MRATDSVRCRHLWSVNGGRAQEAVTNTVRTVSSGEIADMLATVAAANGRLAAGLDVIVAGRDSVSQVTITRLRHLVDQVEPAVAVRERLAVLEPGVLLDGVAEWKVRRCPGLRRGDGR